MNTKYLIAFLLVVASWYAKGQQSIGGEPLSFSMSDIYDAQIRPVTVTAPNLVTLQREDEINDKVGGPLRISRLVDVHFNTQNSGQWTEFSNGDRLWRLKITMEGAMALNLQYHKFYLPEGSRLYIYNEEHTTVLGAFSQINNKQNGVFASGNIHGESCILELFEPGRFREKAVIDINKIGYVYRHAIHPAISFRADPCEVDINCSPEGDDWQDEKHGVVRILLTIGSSQYWCSGSLLNNTSLDCTPYVLTALHCGLGASASDFNQWIFYFNYERAGCGSGTPSGQSITGAAHRADSGDGGGSSGSDFLLIEITNTIPESYDPYWNGWDRENHTSNSGVGIHHPSGDEKKVSTYTSALVSSQWGSASGSHWRVTWSATANGHGVTEGGSSGSPIFNSAGQVVGQLTGGSSYCTSPNSPDYYGKMSYNWDGNPGDDIKDWLDPTSTGALNIGGTYAPCDSGPPPPPPPSDYCSSQGDDQSYEWISNVTVGDVDNDSGASPYSDFTSTTVHAAPGSSVNVSLTPSFSGQTYDEYWRIWIDYNGDLDFDDSGEEVFSDFGSSSVSGSFTVPTSATGTTRMRVSMKWDAYSSPCESFSYGEVEDYSIEFVAGPPPPPPSCGAPVLEAISLYKPTEVKVFWAPVVDAIKYQVRYRPVGTTSWTTKSSLATNKTLKNLQLDTNYEFQLRTQCTDWSDWSSMHNFSTSLGSMCETPIPVYVDNIDMNTVRVHWDAIFDAIRYQIRYRISGTTTWVRKSSRVPLKKLSALGASTTYEYQLRTNCPSGWTSWSSTYTFTTLGTTSQEIDKEGTLLPDLDLTVYPNPAMDYISIKSNKEIESPIMILNIQGVLMKKVEGYEISSEIDISSLSPGMYFVMMYQSDGTRVTDKFMIIR